MPKRWSSAEFVVQPSQVPPNEASADHRWSGHSCSVTPGQTSPGTLWSLCFAPPANRLWTTLWEQDNVYFGAWRGVWMSRIFFFFLFSGEKGSAWRYSVLLGGLLISDGSTLRAREPGGSRHPRGTAAQLSTAGLFQESAVYDWAFLVSIINKHINVITAGVEIKLGLRL